MSSVSLYLQLHRPWVLKNFSIFDIMNESEDYIDYERSGRIFEDVSRKCYEPTMELLLDLMGKYDDFKVALSISGVWVEQAERYTPVLMKLLRRLTDTGKVELLAGSYYHSIACIYKNPGEFEEQVRLHSKLMLEKFGSEPEVFETELYDDRIVELINGLGYKLIVTGLDEENMGLRSSNYLYRPSRIPGVELILKNHKLSDDIAIRFSDRGWDEFPLTSEKYASWLSKGFGDYSAVFMNCEAFGKYQSRESGIFEFLAHLPRFILERGIEFKTPRELAEIYAVKGALDVPSFHTDLLDNGMQRECLHALENMESRIKSRGEAVLLRAWRNLQSSENLYYISKEWFSGHKLDLDTSMHENPYENPYLAFINYMNIILDLKRRL